MDAQNLQENLYDFETSKLLKELGFDEECRDYYSADEDDCGTMPNLEGVNWNQNVNFISAPTWWQVKQWLWEKHKINIEITFAKSSSKMRDYRKFVWFIYVDGFWKNEFSDKQEFDSPVTAEIEGIKQAVEYKFKELKK